MTPIDGKKRDLLDTPATHDSSEQNLLRIVSNIRTESIYRLPVVAVSALNEIWLRHILP